jgi:hypothetical protein
VGVLAFIFCSTCIPIVGSQYVQPQYVIMNSAAYEDWIQDDPNSITPDLVMQVINTALRMPLALCIRLTSSYTALSFWFLLIIV